MPPVYTALTMSGGQNFFDSDLYTDTARPFAPDVRISCGRRIGFAPLLDGGCNAVISVLGNDPSHTASSIFLNAMAALVFFRTSN